jgi:hypothetical protein
VLAQQQAAAACWRLQMPQSGAGNQYVPTRKMSTHVSHSPAFLQDVACSLNKTLMLEHLATILALFADGASPPSQHEK